ncbi:MAG: IQ calmodulin-binding motif-containing protein [Candidatus Chromulinivorax sp.]
MKKIIFFVCAYQFFSFQLLVSSDQNSLFTSIATFAIISFVTTNYVNNEISAKQLQSVDNGINSYEKDVQNIKVDISSVEKNKKITKIQALIRGCLARKMMEQNNFEKIKKIETTNFYCEHSVKTNVSSLTETTCDRQTPDSFGSHSSIDLDAFQIKNYCNQGFGCNQNKERLYESLEDNGFCLVDKNFNK